MKIKEIKLEFLLIQNDLKKSNLGRSKHKQKPQQDIQFQQQLHCNRNHIPHHSTHLHVIALTHITTINLLYLWSFAQIALHIITHSTALALGFNSLSSQKHNFAPYWQIQESSLAVRRFHFTANPSIPHHFETQIQNINKHDIPLHTINLFYLPMLIRALHLTTCTTALAPSQLNLISTPHWKHSKT